jgi:hypothetical protein
MGRPNGGHECPPYGAPLTSRQGGVGGCYSLSLRERAGVRALRRSYMRRVDCGSSPQ